MPVSCSFRLNGKRMSILLCPGLGGVAAFSGDGESIDDPNATTKQDEGPLPAGTYFIVDRESGGRLGWLRDTIKDVLVHSNRREWFALYRNDGVIDDETFINGIKRGASGSIPPAAFTKARGVLRCTTCRSLKSFERS